MSEPTIKQVMRWHQLLTDMVCKVQGLSSDEITELNELEQICGMFDTHEVLYSEIVRLEKALKIAVEALEFYADGESWSTIDHSKSPTTYDRLEYDKDLGDGDFQITEDTDDSNVSGLRARKSLAEIRKLRGEE